MFYIFLDFLVAILIPKFRGKSQEELDFKFNDNVVDIVRKFCIIISIVYLVEVEGKIVNKCRDKVSKQGAELEVGNGNTMLKMVKH